MANQLIKQTDLKQYNEDGVGEDLKHFGIMGMKWGRRRYQTKDGTRTTLGKKRDESEDYIKSRENKSKGLSRLSNDELKKLNERLQLENSYKNLSTVKIKKAKSFVSKSLEVAAGAAATTVATSVFIGAAKLLVKKISPSFAEIIYSK